MDVHEWQPFPVKEEANRKRPWDVISTSTAAEARVPPSRFTTFHDEHEPSRNPEWKRRYATVRIEGSSSWDTSMQTSLWLAQQDSLETIDPMSRGRNASESRSSVQEHKSAVSVPSDKAYSWHPYSDDAPKSSMDERAPRPRRSSPPLGMPTEYDNQHPPSAMPTRREGSSPQSTKTSIAPAARQPYGLCCQDEPMWREYASSISKLAESLIEGSMFDVISQHRREGTRHEQTPLVAEVHRILDLLSEANGLARHVLQTSQSYLQYEKGSSAKDVRRADEVHSPLDVMKRRFLGDAQDGMKRHRRESIEITYRHGAHSNYPSSKVPESANPDASLDISGDRLPPIRTQTPSQVLPDDFSTKLPSMNPPPTPGRQLPSPPGRSHPSPPSYSIPSPSSLLYPQSLATVNASSQQQSLSNILHPLSPTPSSSLGTTTGPSTALQAHTAALQHEVSVKKYALQTLQSEHDKLLAALRRSQTRAQTLEEKQVNSDLEVNTLSEERVRLLAQVSELEQTIIDVSKTRDDFRQAAVKEGAQYVKIVRMASRLEMMTGDERKEWKRQMEECKAKTDSLQASLHANSSAHAEGSAETRAAYNGSVEELKLEVQRLRTRCVAFEGAMRDIRAEGLRFGDSVATLGSAGGQVLACVDAALATI